VTADELAALCAAAGLRATIENAPTPGALWATLPGLMLEVNGHGARVFGRGWNMQPLPEALATVRALLVHRRDYHAGEVERMNAGLIEVPS
jgi:hypothetical protein